MAYRGQSLGEVTSLYLGQLVVARFKLDQGVGQLSVVNVCQSFKVDLRELTIARFQLVDTVVQWWISEKFTKLTAVR